MSAFPARLFAYLSNIGLILGRCLEKATIPLSCQVLTVSTRYHSLIGQVAFISYENNGWQTLQNRKEREEKIGHRNPTAVSLSLTLMIRS